MDRNADSDSITTQRFSHETTIHDPELLQLYTAAQRNDLKELERVFASLEKKSSNWGFNLMSCVTPLHLAV